MVMFFSTKKCYQNINKLARSVRDFGLPERFLGELNGKIYIGYFLGLSNRKKN